MFGLLHDTVVVRVIGLRLVLCLDLTNIVSCDSISSIDWFSEVCVWPRYTSGRYFCLASSMHVNQGYVCVAS